MSHIEKENKVGNVNLSTKKFTSDVAIRFITNGLLQLRSLIFLPIIAKTFGTEGYGIWSQIIVTLNLLTPILMLRLETACVRYLGSNKNKKSISKTFFSMMILIWSVVIFFIFLMLIFPYKFSFFIFGDENLVLYIKLFGVMLLTRVTQTFALNYYRTFNKFKTISIVEIIRCFSEIGLMLIFVLYVDLGLKGAVLSVILVQAFVTIGMLAYIVKSIGFSIDSKIKERLKPYLHYSFPLIFEGALFWVINLSDRYVIVHFLNLSQSGIYSASYALAGMIVFFVTPISYVLFPTISKLWENKEIDSTKKYIAESIKYFLLLAIPSVIGILYFAPFILESLTTAEFVSSRLLILFIVLSYLFFGIYQILYYVVHLKEKTYSIPIIFGVIALFNLVLNLWLVPVYGIIGAAFSTFLSFTLLMLAVIYLSRRWLPIEIEYKSVLKSIGSAIIMLIFLRMFVPKNIFEIIGMILIGFLVYLGCMILFKGVGKKEWDLIKSTFF